MNINYQKLHFAQVKFNKISRYNCYTALELPIINDLDIFFNAVGEFTEIVTKQMFLVSYFKKNADALALNKMVLRPEITAQLVKYFIENNHITERKKYYYFGKVFRYEREQKFRKREFYQIGLEIFNHNEYDICILICEFMDFLKETINFNDYKNIKIRINNLSSEDVLKRFTEYIVQNLNNKDLSCEGKMLLFKNPLRIFDTKIINDKNYIESLDGIDKFLSFQDKEILNKIKLFLIKCGFDIEIDYKLVRGLDYYRGIVFKFYTKDNVTICGGGEFIMSKLSKVAKGIGLSCGFERIEHMILIKPELSNLIILMVNKILNMQELLCMNKLRNNLTNKCLKVSLVNYKSSFSKFKSMNASFIIYNFTELNNKEFVNIYFFSNKKIITVLASEVEQYII